MSFQVLHRFIYPVFQLVSRTLQYLSVARAVSLSFGVAILLGSVLLYLSEHGKLSIYDSIYLSASAFCVTGLSPVDITTLKFRTQVLIILFVQIGGIGIILFTVLIGLMVISGLSRNVKIQELVKGVLDAEIRDEKGRVIGDSEKIGRLIFSIFKITLGIELVGTIFLLLTLGSSLDDSENKFFIALFTSISAFNNAGFSIIDNEKLLTNNPAALYTLTVLIVLGGIGYPVIIYIEKSILEIFHRVSSYFEIYGETYLMRKFISGREPSKLYYLFTHVSAWTEYRIEEYNKRLFGESNIIQTKIIFYGTILLLFGGAVILFALEYNNEGTIGNLTLHEKIANILFLSASSRTAGFNTFPTVNLYDSSIVLICILMFIGGGPQGTAGGIKITTFAILVKYLQNVISSSSQVSIFKQTISKRSVAMSIRLYFLGTSFLAFIILLLTIVRGEGGQLQKIVFEVISAFSTVGFSLSFTSSINNVEKIIYSILMYVGRIGVFTVLIAITGNPATSQMGELDDDVKIQVG